MFCASCGKNLPEEAGFCPACGSAVGETRDPPAVAAAPAARPRAGRVGAATVPAGSPPHSLTFDAKRWGRGDYVVGAAELVLFIALFLPWFSYNAGGFGPVSLSASALDAKGWMYLVFLVALGLMGYLILRAMWDGARPPLPHWQALTGATGLALLLTLLAFLTKPVGTSWSFGAYLGLVAAIVALVGSIIRGKEPEVLPAGGGAGPPSSHLPLAPPTVPQLGTPIPRSSTPRVDSTDAGQPIREPHEVPAVAHPLGGDMASGPVAPVSLQCANCGQSNPPGNKFCNACGRSLIPHATPGFES